jgi:hypothetical protein
LHFFLARAIETQTTQYAIDHSASPKYQFHQDPGLPAPPNNNCGPASLAIVLKALGLEPSGIGEQASINRAAELMGLNPTNHPDASDVDIERGIQNAGGTWIHVGMGSTDQRWNTLNEALANQNPVIAFGEANPGWWSQIGYTNIRSVKHVIAILGRTSNGNYIVAEPLSRRAVEVPQTTLSKFFSIYDNAPTGRAFVLPKSTEGSGTNPSQTSPSPNPQPVTGGYNLNLIPSPWQNNAAPYISMLVQSFASQGITNPRVLAYAAATIGPESSWNPNAKNTTDAAANTGYPGAGLAQITWDYNYKAVSNLTGIDFYNHPEYMFDPLKSLKAKAAFYKMNNMIPLIEAGDYQSAAGIYNAGNKNYRSTYTATVAAAVSTWLGVFS